VKIFRRTPRPCRHRRTRWDGYYEICTGCGHVLGGVSRPRSWTPGDPSAAQPTATIIEFADLARRRRDVWSSDPDRTTRKEF